jgi:hypothetical protein
MSIIALQNVGGPCLIGWKPEYNKKSDASQSSENFSFWIIFKLELSGFFSAFELKLKYQVFLGFEPASLWTEIIPSTLLVVRLLVLDWN